MDSSDTTEHDLVCNADKSLPRYESPGCSCRGREERAAQTTNCEHDWITDPMSGIRVCAHCRQDQPNMTEPASKITLNCSVCQQTLGVLIMPYQPPSPPSGSCILAAMMRDGQWAISEMVQLYERCADSVAAGLRNGDAINAAREIAAKIRSMT